MSIKFRGVCTYERYYSEDSMYGVYNLSTTEEVAEAKLIDKSESNSTGTEPRYAVSIVGKMTKLAIGSEYDIVGDLEYSDKYKAWQYRIKNIKAVVPTTREASERFLNTITNNKRATKSLLDAYPNIIEEITNGVANHRIENVPFVGKVTYEKIKNKVLDNYMNSELIELLSPFGIKHETIMRLLAKEPNQSVLVGKIKDNPYYLTTYSGFGFKSVDKIAYKINPRIKDSKYRAAAFLYHYLSNVAECEGDIWISTKDLEDAAATYVPECIDKLNSIVDEERNGGNFLYIDGDKVGLKKYRNIELSILKRLDEIRDAEFNESFSDAEIERSIKETERRLGFELDEEQKKAVVKSVNSNVSIITGSAGCVDCDTEFFNGHEWKKISEWEDGDKVLQWNRDGTANLVTPQAYIKSECDHFWHIKTKYSVDQCLSDEHISCYYTEHGVFKEISTLDMINENSIKKNGFNGKFITAFDYCGDGIDMSDDMIRLYIAVIADGSFNYTISENAPTYNKARFHLKKQRKKDRLKEICKRAGVELVEKANAIEGYNDYYCYIPFRTKSFPDEWYNCSRHQFEVIADELPYWDGSFCTGNRMYRISTTSKHDADFIQFVYHAIGLRASILTNDRQGKQYFTCGKIYTRKSIEYGITVTKRTLVGITSAEGTDKHLRFARYTSTDGYKYCFRVPSGYLVLRRNNKIFVTHNCGKSCSSKAILDMYKRRGLKVVCCAFAAKAAVRIKEATGFESSTIHSIVQINPETGKVTYDKDNPIPADVVFVDEVSMINDDLLHSLVNAVAVGSRLILVGDAAQLPPIGAGSPFADLLDMPDRYSISKLTKVHRQAQDSGILMDANMIRKGINPLCEPSDRFISGNKKDMIYCFRQGYEAVHELAMEKYLKAVEKYGIDNVVLLTPRKKNCINCTDSFNAEIQSYVNKNISKQIEYCGKYFRVGDRVIQTENNGKKKVFNGETGIVEDVDNKAPDTEECITINFECGDETNIVGYRISEIQKIDLRYALSCHKTQGSQYPYVIIVLDNTHYKLLSRELLYTAITRSQKKCMLIAEPDAFVHAIKNTVKRKRTWMSLETNNG